jgi:predicted TIM-barrel fold metal-dependent hydrolase
MSLNEKVFLASADGHVGAPTEVYRDYVEARYHQAFDDYFAHHKWLWSPSHDESLLGPKLHEKFIGTEGFDLTRGHALAWDASLRLKVLDDDGIAVEVSFPDDQNSNDPPWGSGLATAAVAGTGHESYPAEWQRIGARAYNRWLVDFCSADPQRLRGVTILGTLDDVDWCINEIVRSHESGLRTGVLLPLHYDLPLYHHPRYEPLWSLLEELDLPLLCHVSKGGPDWLGNDPAVISCIWAMESAFYAHRPFWCLTFGGVFERHPGLRLVFTELGADWVAPLLERADLIGNVMGGLVPNSDLTLSMDPSEYFRTNCFLTHSAMGMIQRSDLEGNAFAGVPNMLWGADHGHGEGFWPSGLENLHTLVRGLPEKEMRSYLGENISRAYPTISKRDFADVIARIAPTAAELGLEV